MCFGSLIQRFLRPSHRFKSAEGPEDEVVPVTYHLWRRHSNRSRTLHSFSLQCCVDSQYTLPSLVGKMTRGYYSGTNDTLGIPSYVEGKGYTGDRRP